MPATWVRFQMKSVLKDTHFTLSLSLTNTHTRALSIYFFALYLPYYLILSVMLFPSQKFLFSFNISFAFTFLSLIISLSHNHLLEHIRILLRHSIALAQKFSSDFNPSSVTRWLEQKNCQISLEIDKNVAQPGTNLIIRCYFGFWQLVKVQNCHKVAKNYSEVTKLNLKKFECGPKWQNLAQSGHTEPIHPVPFVSPQVSSWKSSLPSNANLDSEPLFATQ